MTTLPVSVVPGAAAKLRPLSGIEHLFWALDKVNGCNFAIAASSRGSIAHSQWRDAFAQVQARHPLLNAGINDDDPFAPWFTCGAGLPIPLAFLRRASSTHWQRVMESEVAEPFHLSTGPLLRAVVLEDPSGCDLVLTAHHAAVDGMGVVALMRELLQVLAGRPLSGQPVPPSAEERAIEFRALNPLPAPLDGASAEPQPRNRSYASRNRRGKAAVAAMRISPEQTAQLLRLARSEQTTMGALLLAAAASSVRALSPRLQEADLRLTAAVDARPYLGNEEDFVLSIISPRAIVPYPQQQLAASARAIKSQIAPFQSFLAIEAVFARVGEVVAQKLDAATLVNMLAKGFAHDVGVSNLKTLEFPAQAGSLVVESVWGPSVLAGYEGEHFIGSATFAGALHLVYSSFTPLPGLLGLVIKKLTSTSGTGCIDTDLKE
jgi:hypothetical protein